MGDKNFFTKKVGVSPIIAHPHEIIALLYGRFTMMLGIGYLTAKLGYLTTKLEVGAIGYLTTNLGGGYYGKDPKVVLLHSVMILENLLPTH